MPNSLFIFRTEAVAGNVRQASRDGGRVLRYTSKNWVLEMNIFSAGTFWISDENSLKFR
jgi:hypothetical protein